ncbi:MAG: FAD-binding oxidoreductase, partial [Limisphaerales bacterium]
MTSIQRTALKNIKCEVASDDLTRTLYASDASLHQLMPSAVAFPRTAQEASAAVKAAVDCGLSITPRGAGTGLVGGAIGDGLIIDFGKYNREISNIDLDRGTVRVGTIYKTSGNPSGNSWFWGLNGVQNGPGPFNGFVRTRFGSSSGPLSHVDC